MYIIIICSAIANSSSVVTLPALVPASTRRCPGSVPQPVPPGTGWPMAVEITGEPPVSH